MNVMKKGKYEAPAILVVKLETESIICDSNWPVNGTKASSSSGEWGRSSYGDSDEI